MAFKQSYAAQTDIPEGWREHYTERDGAWWIETDPPADDVTGLKSALANERTLRRDAERAVSEYKTKYDTVDLDEIAKLRERVKGMDDADIYDKQGLEALVARRVESLKTDHERVLRMRLGEIENLKVENGILTQRWKQDKIRTALLAAVGGSGVDKDAVEDAVSRGLAVFKEVDDQGNVLAKNGDDVRYGRDGINPLTPAEWIANLKADGHAKHLWPGSQGSGAPANHGAGSGTTDWAAITNPAERLTRFREAQRQGRP